MNDKKKLMLKILIGSLVLIISLFAFGVESFSSAYQQEVSVKTPMDATVTLSSSKDYFDAVDDVVLHVIIKNPNSYSRVLIQRTV